MTRHWQTPAVVFGAHVNGASVVRSLGSAGVPVHVVQTLKSDIAQYSRYAKSRHTLFEVSEDPDSIVDFLEARLPDWEGAVLVPSNDHALSGLARNHTRLSQHFRLTCPPWEIVERVIDKSVTATCARTVGVAVPHVYGIANTDFDDFDEIRYPVLVKPVQSHRFIQKLDRKLFVAENEKELRDALARVTDTGLVCEIQQCIEGPESALRMYQTYIDRNGEARGEFAINRTRLLPPGFGVARAAQIAPAEDLRAPSLQLLKSIGWRGMAELEFKRDTRTGLNYLIEINGRNSLLHGLPLRAGVNFTLMAYSEALEEDIAGYEPNGWTGTWINIQADFIATLKSLGRDDQSLLDILKSYCGPLTFADWSRDDMRPFLMQWWLLAKKALRLIRQRLSALFQRTSDRNTTDTQQMPSVSSDIQGTAPKVSVEELTLRKRMDFADAARFQIDSLRHAAKRPRKMASIQWDYYGLNLVHDLVQRVSSGCRVSRPGRPHLAGLASDLCLHQFPPYRAYWYDAERHALVGALLGVDLHRYNGRYYVLEANLTAGLMRTRRDLYQVPVDPMITELIAFAKAHGFARLVLHRRTWRHEYVEECAQAMAEGGVEIVLKTSMREPGEAHLNPAPGLPDPLEDGTMYVACTAISESAIFQFLHNKSEMERWLPKAIGTCPVPLRLLASVPSAKVPKVQPISDDPRWPNMVIKLANSDEGQAVVMGRFDDEAAARDALGLPTDGVELPAVLMRPFHRRIAERLFPGTMSAVYQSFVPPENIEGYPAMMRMEGFFSPLGDAFLSAHGTRGGVRFPKEIPLNTVLEKSPFNVSVPPGQFYRLDDARENELMGVAQEFGGVLRQAVQARFRTGPDK